MRSIADFVAAVPKVELHLHLVGSASPAVVAELAARHPDAGVPTSVEALDGWFAFTNFEHFIEVYDQVSSLVRSGEDIAVVVESSARDLAAQHVRYAEMTVTPHTFIRAGIPHDDVVEGLTHGRTQAQEHGVEFAWVYDIPGEMGQDAARITLDAAVENPPPGLVGFGLGGLELGVDRSTFAWAFDAARAAGLKSVPHAGEADGPASVVAALDDLKADRIGHGVRAVEDPSVLRRLVEERIPLEVCPSSNVCTGVFGPLADHCLPELLAAGAFVTINTDDPPMFSTTLNEEYLKVASTFDLDLATIADLVRNGVEASFLPPDRKATLLAEITAVECKP